MPQPFKGVSSFGMDEITKRPQLAAQLGIITAQWAYVECSMTNLLADLLGIDAEMAVAMYVAITNDGSRQAALKEIAAIRLDKTHETEFSDILGSIKRVLSKRNDLVHGLWGISVDENDVLIWADSRTHAKAYGSIVSAVAKTPPDISSLKKTIESMERHLQTEMKYNATDFLEIREMMTAICERLDRFRAKLH